MPRAPRRKTRPRGGLVRDTTPKKRNKMPARCGDCFTEELKRTEYLRCDTCGCYVCPECAVHVRGMAFCCSGPFCGDGLKTAAHPSRAIVFAADKKKIAPEGAEYLINLAL